MAKKLFLQGMTGRFLPVMCVLAGLAVALLIAAAPAALLDAVVARMRLGALLPAAAPPIGVTGRTIMALAGGAAIAVAGAAPLLWRSAGRRNIRATPRPLAPPQRRADAHPDAPARRPINASSELGAPLPIARELPVPDEDESDPAPARPAAIEADERLETFALPPVDDDPEQRAASLEDLLDRLERGAMRRAAARNPPPPPLDETLGKLRRLAAN